MSGRAVTVTVDGEPLTAVEGTSVAVALLVAGRRSWRTTAGGQRRGLFCAIGVCFDCTASVDGERGRRLCLTPVSDGLDIRTVAP